MIKLDNKFWKLIKDFIWNIAATAINTVALQLLIYPLLARWLNSSAYGEMLTVMGIANIIVVAFGGGLNNVRLIQQEKYSKEITGDFNLFLLGSCVLGTIIYIIVTFNGFHMGEGQLLVSAGYVIFGIIRNYFAVAYRLKIDYIANFKMTIVIVIGYAIGLAAFVFTGLWPFCFCLAELMGVGYLLATTTVYRESWKKTKLFYNTAYVLVMLIINALIGNIVTYLDRLLLYPIMGGEQVSIFTVSSFMGKSVGILATPIAGVLLSYYAQSTFQMTVRKYWKINIVLIILGAGGGAIAIAVSPWITGLLYPTLIMKALPYIIVANGAALIGVLANVVSPSALKYAETHWMLIVQMVYIGAYLMFGMLFLKKYGLMGFCVANGITNILRLLGLMIIGYRGIVKMTTKI